MRSFSPNRLLPEGEGLEGEREGEEGVGVVGRVGKNVQRGERKEANAFTTSICERV